MFSIRFLVGLVSNLLYTELYVFVHFCYNKGLNFNRVQFMCAYIICMSVRVKYLFYFIVSYIYLYFNSLSYKMSFIYLHYKIS